MTICVRFASELALTSYSPARLFFRRCSVCAGHSGGRGIRTHEDPHEP